MSATLSPAIPEDIDALARTVLQSASDLQLTLATAESCTGGLLASLLTDIEGLSNVFERGFVTYSEQSKCDLLGIARTSIDSCGAVSEEVARAMASGAMAASRADVAVAITGFAGRGRSKDEAGLVHFACAVRSGPVTACAEHFGDIGRGPVRLAALRQALRMQSHQPAIAPPDTLVTPTNRLPL